MFHKILFRYDSLIFMLMKENLIYFFCLIKMWRMHKKNEEIIKHIFLVLFFAGITFWEEVLLIFMLLIILHLQNHQCLHNYKTIISITGVWTSGMKAWVMREKHGFFFNISLLNQETNNLWVVNGLISKQNIG